MGGAGAGGGRAARALRLLLLLVMALAALEYLCASVFEASPLRSYLHAPVYNVTLPTLKSREAHLLWSKQVSVETSHPGISINVTKNVTKNHTTDSVSKENVSKENASKENGSKEHVSKENVNKETSTNYNSTSTTEVLETRKPVFSTKKVQEETSVKPSQSSSTLTTKGPALPYCEVPSNLGPISANKTEIELSSIENKFPEVSLGGWFKPRNCTARHRVAIIIPYRDRPQHLAIFLNHMHPFLMRQRLDYGIFVIEQHDSKPKPNSFNRAKLFNVGFVEANKAREGGWQCFVFHDVDLLPLDERNLYTCPKQPRHMSPSLDKFNYKLIYQDLFGGVSAMTLEQFTKVNGFSNKYWGWGGEDDDMSYRIRKMNYHIARYKMSIARYTMLSHKPQAPNTNRYKLLSQTDKNFRKDGLSNLEYEVIKIVKHRLFTLVSVNIDEHS